MMKKILFTIAIVSVLISKTNAQHGFDFSLSPSEFRVAGAGSDESALNRNLLNPSINYGINLGYHRWTWNHLFWGVSLRALRGTSQLDAVRFSGSAPPTIQTYDINANTFLINIESNISGTELDWKDHFYGGFMYSFGIRQFSSALQSTKPLQDLNNELIGADKVDNIDKSQFVARFSFNLGYQYNFKRMLGIYGQIGAGFSAVQLEYIVDNRIGLRYRIK